MRVLLSSVVALLIGAGAGTSSVRNEELGFSIAVPDSFVDYPAGRAQKDFVYYWIEQHPSSDSGRLILGVTRLGGVIGREPASPRDLPAGMQPMTYRWKGFDIEGGKSVTEQSGVRLVSFVAQIPLRNEAIQIVVAAPERDAERAQALMTSTLLSLDGETNWLNDEERAQRLGESVGRLLVPTIALIAVGVWMRRRKGAAAARAA